MPQAKPFHRNWRTIKKGPNSGYSSWGYIIDRKYAKDPEHYTRAYTLIQHELQSIFEYLEPSDECRQAFSYRIHALLMRTCIEVEANFKAILSENICSTPSRQQNIGTYRKVDVTHHLSSYEVQLPIWHGGSLTIRPFEPWKAMRGVAGVGSPIPWYQAYNASKHDRHQDFKKASFETLVAAVAGLLVLVSSQFRDEDFTAGPRSLSIDGYEYYELEASLGNLFRIKYPDDWPDAEMYEFNWTDLAKQSDPFAQINYDIIL